jgi:hypothetical protein
MAGNCGCSKCGLRGYSKNVTCRNTFAIWDDYLYLQSYELNVRLTEKDGQSYWSFKRTDYSGDVDRLMSFSEVLKEFIGRADFKPEHLDIVFCEHDWVQDPGTETV